MARPFLVWALISTIISQITGAMWYGPLFGKQYGDAVGMKKDYTPSKKEMVRLLVIEFISKFVFFLAFAYLVIPLVMTGATPVSGSIVAFALTALMVQISQITWSTHKPSLYWIMGLKLLLDIVIACGVWLAMTLILN